MANKTIEVVIHAPQTPEGLAKLQERYDEWYCKLVETRLRELELKEEYKIQIIDYLIEKHSKCRTVNQVN